MLETQSLSLADLDLNDAEPILRGNERRYLCPLPSIDCQGKPRDNGHRCLCVNASSGLWNCKRCKAQGKLREYWDGVGGGSGGRTRGLSRRAQAQWDLAKRFAVPVAPQSASRPASTKTPGGFDWHQAWAAAHPVPTPEEAAAGGHGRTVAEGSRYILSRSISLQTARETGVRLCDDWCGGRAVLFPQYDFAGHLVAVHGRYIQPRQGAPKGRTLGAAKEGVFTASCLIGEATGNPRYLSAWDMPALILCEGAFDALALAEVGYAALATGGTTLPTWMHRRAAFRPALIAPDADTAGDEAAVAWERALAPFAASCKRLRPELGKDWNEELQVLGRDGLADWVAPFVLGL